jgi:hypothetical protein
VNTYYKIAIGLVAGYGGYKLYQLYQLGEKIQYTPVGFNYSNGVIQVKMKLDNPIATTLKMRGVDGKLYTGNTILGTFASGPFEIKQGVSYFTLDFKIDALNSATQLLTSLIFKTIPTLTMQVVKKIPFISLKETFEINPAKLD